jgi:streptogramin lyase
MNTGGTMSTKIAFRGFAFIILISVYAGLVCTTSAQAGLPAFEADTNPAGSVYEINPDSIGKLWISDSDAGEILGFNPENGSYDVYIVGGNPVDARRSGDWLWWADSASLGFIGRINTTTDAYTFWRVGNASFLYSTYLDTQGRLYTADNLSSNLYRLDPGLNQLCTYILPDSGKGSYIVATGAYLWLGDWQNGRILQLQPNISSSNLKIWTLEAKNYPHGMTVDNDGSIWYTDQEPDSIVKFIPGLNLFTRYKLPVGGDPYMLTTHKGLIWYTTQALSSVGSLDPLTADNTTFSSIPSTSSLAPTCNTVTPSQTGTINPLHRTLSWTPKSYTTLVNSGGWHIFEMPADSYPWGIALVNNGFVTDYTRNVLSKFILTQYGMFLPFVSK